MDYRLPHSIITKSQLASLQRELVRLSTAKTAKQKKLSDDLEQFLAMNRIGTITAELQKKLLTALAATAKNAPQITIALGSLPDTDERIELITWLRSQIHPQLLLHIVQDSDVIAGAVIRTERNVYDYSLHSAIFSNTNLLAQKL